jgi:tetratricopeptide (TPR) repeat protein
MTLALTMAHASARQAPPPRPITNAQHCYRADRYVPPSEAQVVADMCTPDADDERRHSARDIAFAAYYAGVANRYRGEVAKTAGDLSEANARFADAERLLARAIALSPTARDAQLQLAWVRYDQGRSSEAIALVDEVLRLESNPESALHASAHYLRGRVLQDGSQGTAALADFNAFINDSLDGHPDARDARLRIIQIATTEGSAAMANATREDAQRAIDLLTLAQSAAAAGGWNFVWPIDYGAGQHLYAADIHHNAGLARLAMARALSPAGADRFVCAAQSAPAEWLEQARGGFMQALTIDSAHADAHANLACVELALGRTETAIAEATAAVGAHSSAANYIMLGRAHASVTPATEQSLAAGASAFESAVTTAPPGRERARILVDVASIHLRLADANPTNASTHISLAAEKLRAAVAEDNAFALAHARLGEVLFNQGVKPGETLQESLLADAHAHFERANTLTDPRDTLHGLGDQGSDNEVRATALYYLSRLAVEWPGHLNERRAITLADAALELQAAWPHRRQACLARIRFARVQPNDGSSGYCVLTGQPAPNAEAHVLEGMYYLRQAQLLSNGPAHRALEGAYRAFTQGLAAPIGPEQDRRVRALLLQGQGTAQFCVGFATLGHDLIASAEAQYGAEALDAHRLFDAYRVMTCDGTPHVH